MAEPAAPPARRPVINNRVLLIAVGVVILLVVLFFAWSFRGCVPGVKEGGYQVIYSNLDLKDAANVVGRLKELKVSYELRDKGTAVAVPKDLVDDARLGLAEKNLPMGGVVGWEIFNETRMGTTDFDRRIQLIRAISGELSRTIRRIHGVEDARVQIVLPETRLFEATKAPATAAVLLKLSPGFKIKRSQVKGIIHLVASSVENLQPENITVVDESGTIISGKYVPPPKKLVSEVVTEKAKAPFEQKIIKKKKEKEKVEPPKPLSPEEKTLLKLKAKEEYERQLAKKIQDILNSFYPKNSVLVKASVYFGRSLNLEKITTLKIKSDNTVLSEPIKMIKIIVLVDKKIKLSSAMKKITYQTVSEAIPYDRRRGDRIVIKRVPFRYALPEFEEEVEKELPGKKIPIAFKLPKINFMPWVIFAGAGLLIILITIRYVRGRGKKKKKGPQPFEEGISEEEKKIPSEEEAALTIGQIKKITAEDPQKLANLLKKWLTEK